MRVVKKKTKTDDEVTDIDDGCEFPQHDPNFMDVFANCNA